MFKSSSAVFVLSLIGVALVFSSRGDGALAAPGAPVNEARTPQEAVHKICNACHDMQIVMDTPKDFDAWHDTVQKMIDHGAQGTPQEFDLVMQYILENVTTVDVNHADPAILAGTLHASDASVSAILSRRAQKPFHDLDDLLNAVPSLDAAALRAKSRMIFFGE